MGVGLQVRGALKSGLFRRSPVCTPDALEAWLRQNCTPFLRGVRAYSEDSHAAIDLELHPAAETLRIRFEKDDELVASAQTSSAGPGYHIYVCELLKHIASDLRVAWKPTEDGEGDETGYFESGDQSRVYREMLDWLSGVCRLVLDMHERGHADLAIALPMDVIYQNIGFLTTQLGPRSREWVEHTARDPEQGLDFFPWLRRKPDAGFYLRRALCLMWTTVRWRKPLLDDEKLLLNEVCEDLQRAWLLDASLQYPRREWAEMLGYLNSGTTVPDGHVVEGPLVGFRRLPVKTSLVPGWTIRIPGGFAERWEDNKWIAWDNTMTLWVVPFKKDGVTAASIISEFRPGSDDIVTHKTDRILGKSSIQWVEDEGQKYWMLRAYSAAEGQFCYCMINFADASYREQAVEIWRSLTM